MTLRYITSVTEKILISLKTLTKMFLGTRDQDIYKFYFNHVELEVI